MSLLLNRENVQSLLTMDDVIKLLEQAFSELVQGTAIMPQRTAVSDPDHNGWYAFMPAQLKTMGMTSFVPCASIRTRLISA